MIKIIKKVIYEPLFQFLLLGLLLYIYYSTTVSSDTIDKRVLNISSHEINQIKLEYKKENGYEINEEQLNATIASKYYEKILLSEAYALGLEKQDKEISSLLLKKMYFLIINSSEIIEPTEEELFEYYKKNIIDYSLINHISFAQVYFANPKDKRVDEQFELLKVANISSDKAAYFGDMSKVRNIMKDATYEEVVSVYGKYFASKLFNLKKGLWHKALHSKYGIHLIYVSKKDVSDAYSFDEIQGRVYLDYLADKLQEKEKKAYDDFTSQYILNVQ